MAIVNGVLIDGRACKGDIIIPDGVREIGDGAFSVAQITSVVIPDSVEKIGMYAFFLNTKLRSVKLGKGVNR